MMRDLVALLLLCFFLAFLPSSQAHTAKAEKRVALVIGNGDYRHWHPLPNPSNDAAAIAEVLRGLGFEVIEGRDLDKAQTDDTIRKFAYALERADIGLFYYAGHGLQVDGRNYLMPVDAKLARDADLDFEATGLDFVIAQLDRNAKTSLIFLDACRDNPVIRRMARGGGRTRGGDVAPGLAAVRAKGGTLISFATEPDNVALDTVGGANSPYTTALAKHLPTPDLAVEIVLQRVTQDVYQATDGRQTPWVHSSIRQALVLNPSARTPVAFPGPLTPPAAPEDKGPKASATPVHECDRLAAFEFDETRAAKGVAIEKIDIEKAIPACEAARREYPDEPRFAYQLGRAVLRSPNPEQARPIFEALAAKGHAPSMNGIGFMLNKGLGVERNDVQAIEWLKKAALAGLPIAAMQVGSAYYNGVGVTLDKVEAYRWYSLAAEAGNVIAMGFIGIEHLRGESARKDVALGETWLRRAAEKGFPMAMAQLALSLLSNETSAERDREAILWLEKAKQLGDAEAITLLASAYRDGRGVSKDIHEALRLYTRAAVDLRDARAHADLGDLYFNGKHRPKDEARAAHHYRAAADNGHEGAMELLGYLLETGQGLEKDLVEARRRYQAASDKGRASAMSRLAQMMIRGEGGEKDVEAGVALLERAADLGSGHAMLGMWEVYAKGIGRSADILRAIEWMNRAAQSREADVVHRIAEFVHGMGGARYLEEAARHFSRAAEMGHAPAMIRLAEMRMKGEGGGKDAKQALALYETAAKAGDARAMLALARLHEHGKDVERNDAEAVRWYQSAADSKLPEALYRLGQLKQEGKLVPLDILGSYAYFRAAAEAGHADAIAWLANHYLGVADPEARRLGELWLQKAVAAGSHQAKGQHGVRLLYGLGADKDPAKGLAFIRAAAEGGDTDAMTLLASLYWEGEAGRSDVRSAIAWSQKAADAGSNPGKAQLAVFLAFAEPPLRNTERAIALARGLAGDNDREGLVALGVIRLLGEQSQRDPKEAVGLLVRAADLGHSGAQTFLGDLYRHGLHVARDYQRARDLYERSAAQNDRTGLTSLAYLYFEGLGVAPDHVKALALTHQAIELGERTAMVNFGDALERGLGVPRDPAAAVAWAFAGFRQRWSDLGLDKLMIELGKWSEETRKALQARLQQAGVYSGKIDGKLGSATRAAIQRVVDLEPEAVPVPVLPRGPTGAMAQQ
jgi:hypothetical protein